MIVHLNGELVEDKHAQVSVFDRGFLMGDGVYEGLRISDGRVVGMSMHIKRLISGLRESRIAWPGAHELPEMTDALLHANNLRDAFVYWQITRGTPGPEGARRSRAPGDEEIRPTVFGYAEPLESLESWTEPMTRRVAIRPDMRWTRGGVKAISLLGSVLSAIEAKEQGADDAILVRDGLVTEGVASNVVLGKNGVFVTPGLESAPMLAGVTRRLLLSACPQMQQRPVTVEELRHADEIMLVGTVTMVAAVTHLDGEPVGAGAAGPMSQELLRMLRGAIERDLAANAVD